MFLPSQKISKFLKVQLKKGKFTFSINRAKTFYKYRHNQRNIKYQEDKMYNRYVHVLSSPPLTPSHLGSLADSLG